MKDEVYFYLQQHAAAIPKEGTHGHIGHVLGTFYLFFKNIIHSTKYYYSRISRAIANVLSDMSEVEDYAGVLHCTNRRADATDLFISSKCSRYTQQNQ